MSTTVNAPVAVKTTGTTRLARASLIGVGTLGTIFGLYLLLTTVRPSGLVGLGIWLLGALVLHDALLAPILLLAQRALHRLGRRLPGAIIALVQAGVLVGGIFTLVAVPAIWAQMRGARNDSVINLPYGFNLFIVWALVSALVLAGSLAFYIRQRHGTSASQGTDTTATGTDTGTDDQPVPAPVNRPPLAAWVAGISLVTGMVLLLTWLVRQRR